MVALAGGAPVVMVDATGSLLRVGSLGQALPIGSAGAIEGSGPASSGQPGETVAADSGLLGPATAPTSVLAMALVTLASILATLLRRRLVRLRLREVGVARLATLRPPLRLEGTPERGPAGGPRGGPSVG